jgi:GT2 family glycosyltransferase
MVRTAAVVVDWRRPDDTLAALRSLADMAKPPDVLVCVENGSSSEDVAVVRETAPPATKVVELPQNIGWPSAVNLGVAQTLDAGADWILLLNNDAKVERNCLGRLIEEATRYPRVAAAGPAISFADHPERLWFGGGEVSDWFAFTRHRGLMASSAKPPASSDTGFITGCCMLVSGTAWRDMGPFRADFFAYYEDAEWCQRVRAGGWRCRYVGEVLCTHAVSATWLEQGSLGLSEATAYYKARNPLRFALETKALGRRLTRILGVLVVWNAYHAWILLQLRRADVAMAYLRGMIDAVRGHMGPYSKLVP